MKDFMGKRGGGILAQRLHFGAPLYRGVNFSGTLRPKGWRAAVTALLLSFLAFSPTYLLANPAGEVVRHGTATFERSGNDLIIRQDGEKLVVNWQSFSVANGELTKFIQPGASSSALNRVMGGSRSLIDGRWKRTAP